MSPTSIPRPSSDTLRSLALRLASDSPRLNDLDSDQLERLAQSIIWANLRDDLKRLSDLARINYATELSDFLGNVSPTGSVKTMEAYAWGIAKLEDWARRQGIEFLEIGPRQADDYIYSLRALEYAPASVRIQVAGASAFFSYLERRFPAVRNPFRGTKARPRGRPIRTPRVPNDLELSLMVASCPPDLRAAILCMGYRGLRVGALPTLVIEGDRFYAVSKGKEIRGHMPARVIEAVAQAHLSSRRPFEARSSTSWSQRVYSLSRRLRNQGLIQDSYSAHDLRHAFAVREYRAHGDLYALKQLLSHHSTSVTERYLRSMGELS